MTQEVCQKSNILEALPGQPLLSLQHGYWVAAQRSRGQFAPKGICPLFSDISERNNDYSDTLDFRRRGGGGVMFFVLEVPDNESVMLIY